MITITFNPYTPEQIAILTAAMIAYTQAARGEDNVEPTTLAEIRPVNEPITEDKPKKAKKPAAEKPAAEETPAPEPVTLEQLRAKMAAVSQAGKGPECKALLVKFGASNLTSVPAEKYGELMNEVGAL
jgi:type IV secretory pathway VirB10-like protein